MENELLCIWKSGFNILIINILIINILIINILIINILIRLTVIEQKNSESII